MSRHEEMLPIAVVETGCPDGKGGTYCRAFLEGWVLNAAGDEKYDLSGHKPSGATPVQALANLRRMLVDFGLRPQFQLTAEIRAHKP